MAALGMLSLTGCEGGDLYKIDAPDWLADKIAEFADSGDNGDTPEIEGLHEDVYNIGNADLTASFFTLGKTYVIPAGQKWQAQFNLTVNPDNKYYKNFYVVLNQFNGDVGDEYGVIRYDNDPNKNSEWNTVGTEIDRSLIGGNFNNASGDDDLDPSVQDMNGKVTLTVDRSNGGLYIEMNNGKLKKTYTQTTPFPSTDPGVDICCRIGVEASLVSFLGSTIEPIGGYTSKEDKQPLSLTLKGIPGKVLVGTDMETVIANATAEVQFEQGVSKTVAAKDLTFQAIPSLNSLGTKNIVAAYNLTYKGEAAVKPVIGSTEIQVVDKMYTCVGSTDNTTAFWQAHSERVKINPKETFVTTFTNYTSGANNWNNWVVVLNSEDGLTEYGVLRADNWGWGTGWAGEELASKCTPSGGQANWDTWRAAMDGAKVTMYITNNGNGTADVKTVTLGTDGQTYIQDYIGLNTVTNPDDFYFHLTVDGSHIEFDDVLGAEDNSSTFWSAHSEQFKVPAKQTLTRRFRNYGGGSNWNNFVICLTSEDGLTEYGILRADNWGWGTGWAGEELASKCTPSGGQANWDTWLAAMEEAMVTVSVTNNGNGTADVKCVMLGKDGQTYIQDYIGLNTVNSDDLWFRFTIDGCHLVFE
jgi:hypothetical protein